MGWTVIARISYDNDKGAVTARVTDAMKAVGFSTLGTGLWQCLCSDEASMKIAVDAVTGNLVALGDGVTLDHVILNVLKQ